MIIAQKKRKENIAEFVIYMWQIEDIIRSLGFDIEKIEQNIINQFDVNKNVRLEMYQWYTGLIEQMQTENITIEGHLQSNINCINDLFELHNQIINNPKASNYKQKYFQALPLLKEFQAKSDFKGGNEVEIAFRLLYTVFMLKLKQVPITKETSDALDVVKDFIKELTIIFHQREHGEAEEYV